jgi:peptide/nickel transport system permease protein
MYIKTKLKYNKSLVIGFFIFSLVILLAVFSPYLTSYDPLKIDVVNRLKVPNNEHLLGTDELGRDVFTRLLYGSRISISVGLVSVSIALIIGIPLGLISAYYGKIADSMIMRFMDALAAFPAILLALAILSVLGPSIHNAMIAIGIVYLPAFSRVVRGSVLTVKNNEFVHSANSIGSTEFRILFRTILPNCLSPIIVHASLGIANAIIIEAALGYLGLGAQPPTPSWGAMLEQGRHFMNQNVWYSISAGMAIFITVIGINLLGDGLRDLLDPQLK